MLEFDRAVVEHQQGAIDPPPLWPTVIMRAKWLGVAPWELIEQDECWGDWAGLLMEIEAEQHNRKSGQPK